jgi:hypothetical protein
VEWQGRKCSRWDNKKVRFVLYQRFHRSHEQPIEFMRKTEIEQQWLMARNRILQFFNVKAYAKRGDLMNQHFGRGRDGVPIEPVSSNYKDIGFLVASKPEY